MSALSPEAVGTIVLAVAALINSMAYVLRRKADASAALVQSLLGRVQQMETHIAERDTRIAQLEAEVRHLRSQVGALVDEAESLRDAISASRGVIPAPPRIHRREITGRHSTLTQELLAERGHGDQP